MNDTKMKLKPGPNQKERINVKNTRGMAFCGLGAFVGTGKTQRAHGTDTNANYVP
jgi:hypothetical protein